MMRLRLLWRKNSILQRIWAIMLGAILLQFALLTGTLLLGGTFSELQHNALDILNEKVTSRRNDIEVDMVRRWGSLSEASAMISNSVESVLLREESGYSELGLKPELSQLVLDAVSEDLIFILRRNRVTGSFFVLNTPDASRPGLYIHDSDPDSNPDDYSDLMIKRGPSDLVRKLGISTDSNWKPRFTFDEGGSTAFFDRSVAAAASFPNAQSADLGYWSPPFQMEGKGSEIVTYTVPLVTPSGRVYGVLGVELTVSYLVRQLPYAELAADAQGGYLLAFSADGGSSFQKVAADGPRYQSRFKEGEDITLGNSVSENIFEVADKNDIYGCVKNLRIYNRNTPFENEQWALIGLVERNTLFSLATKIQVQLIIALAVDLLIGIVGVGFAGMMFARPITELADTVKRIDASKPVRLKQIHIAEIDDLSRSIEYLSGNVAEVSSRFSTIMKLSDYAIGAFECYLSSELFFYTDRFFELIGRPDLEGKKNVTRKDFVQSMRELEKRQSGEAYDPSYKVYRIPQGDGIRWIKLKVIQSEEKVLGVLTDITAEFLEKQRIEHDRDYDLLTNLLNRRAFYMLMGRRFAAPEAMSAAAMIMMDLDNLKYMNDTYGHDCGDNYIRSVADVLRGFVSENAVVARMSGDEFYIFINGENRAEVQAAVDAIETAFYRSEIVLPDGQTLRIRISAGIAWYPDDSSSFEQLIQYADFAMYHVKHTSKGSFGNFNEENYQREVYLLKNKEQLNKLIDGELVDYEFQPIIQVKDGAVHGYEALMRPRVENINSPLEVMSLARFQSKQYDIEQLTWRKSLEAFSALSAPDEKPLIFINSIPNQILGEDVLRRLEKQYPAYLSRVVMEFTEEDRQSATATEYKQQWIRAWGGSTALDDFGAGYNGESTMLMTATEYIKIDQSLVRDVDRDTARAELVRNMTAFAHRHGIRVIAEGVETQAEMEVLVLSKVDYLQGYYLGYPQHELAGLTEETANALRIAYEARKKAEAAGRIE